MLRIVSDERDGLCTITLHGKLAGDWVPVLDRFWQGLSPSVPSASVTAVLSNVSFIDAEGERLLERMWRAGVRLVASGCMNRHVVERIEGRAGSRDKGPESPRHAPRRGGRR
jgi:hypothetical protein